MMGIQQVKKAIIPRKQQRPSIPPPTPATNRLLCFLQERKPKRQIAPPQSRLKGH